MHLHIIQFVFCSHLWHQGSITSKPFCRSISYHCALLSTPLLSITTSNSKERKPAPTSQIRKCKIHCLHKKSMSLIGLDCIHKSIDSNSDSSSKPPTMLFFCFKLVVFIYLFQVLQEVLPELAETLIYQNISVNMTNAILAGDRDAVAFIDILCP